MGPTVRLYRSLISTSAHLIRVTQCEYLIARADDPEKCHNDTHNEIHSRWLKNINTHLVLDCLMTSSQKYGGKAIKEQIILQTWSGTLKGEEHLPKCSTKQAWRFSGYGASRPHRSKPLMSPWLLTAAVHKAFPQCELNSIRRKSLLYIISQQLFSSRLCLFGHTT